MQMYRERVWRLCISIRITYTFTILLYLHEYNAHPQFYNFTLKLKKYALVVQDVLIHFKYNL
jgi:hypothetical protein